MSNILIINAHQYYPFSEGKLNQTLVEKAIAHLHSKGHETRVVTMKDDYDVEAEVIKVSPKKIYVSSLSTAIPFEKWRFRAKTLCLNARWTQMALRMSQRNIV